MTRSVLPGLLALALAGCAATSNPRPEAGAARTPREAGGASDAPATPAASQATDAAPGAAPDAAPAAEPTALTIGRVSEEPIDVRAFLERLWIRESQTAREVFEYLVLSRIAILEAQRLGVVIDPEKVEATVQRARDAILSRLRETGSGLTLAQHVQRTLEMDLATYERKLRADAIIQLLTERCVRSWYLSNERVLVRVIELADEQSLDAAQAALAAGTSSEEVARSWGVDDAADQGGTQMTVVRSEASDLARLAFVTPVGQVGGPLVQDGRFLLVCPLERLAARDGLWEEVGAEVERNLAEAPIDADRLEYVQWRAAMMARYPIDLSPFVELVTGAAP